MATADKLLYLLVSFNMQSIYRLKEHLDRIFWLPMGLLCLLQYPHRFSQFIGWHKNYGARPMLHVDNVEQLNAVLLMGVLRCDNRTPDAASLTQAIQMLVREHHMTPQAAQNLLLSAAFLVYDEFYVLTKLPAILILMGNKLSSAQHYSLIQQMCSLATVNGAVGVKQRNLIDFCNDTLMANLSRVHS